MWEQIAPLNQAVRRLQKYAELAASELVSTMNALPGKPIKERRSTLVSLGNGELRGVFDQLQRENQALAQYQALRLWHLTVAADPGLTAYVSELRRELRNQQALLDSQHSAVAQAVQSTNLLSWLESVTSHIDARNVERQTSLVLAQLEELRTKVSRASLGLVPPSGTQSIEGTQAG